MSLFFSLCLTLSQVTYFEIDVAINKSKLSNIFRELTVF